MSVPAFTKLAAVALWPSGPLGLRVEDQEYPRTGSVAIAIAHQVDVRVLQVRKRLGDSHTNKVFYERLWQRRVDWELKRPGRSLVRSQLIP